MGRIRIIEPGVKRYIVFCIPRIFMTADGDAKQMEKRAKDIVAAHPQSQGKGQKS